MSNILKTIKYKDNKYSINYNGSINDFIKQIKNKLQIIMIKKFIVHLEGFKNIEIDFNYLNNLEDLLKAPFFKYLEIISFENNNIIIEELKKEIQKLNTINQSLEFEIKSLKNDITMLKNEYDKFKDTHNEEIKKIYKLIEENINNTNKFNKKIKNNVDNIKDSYYNKIT
jgi:predicted nuclease with TOPRIM domain